MRISVGIDRNDTLDDLEHYIELGAGAFFCGCVPEDWGILFGDVPMNKRNSSLAYDSLEWLSEVCFTAHKNDVEVFVTLNSHYYLSDHYPYLLEYAKGVTDSGSDALIVSDIALIRAINETCPSIPIIVSGEVGVYNRSTIEFLLAHCSHVRRIILPRQISLLQLAALVQDKELVGDLEFEVFVMNGRCPFEGAGYCQVDYLYVEDGHVCIDQNYERTFYWRTNYAGLTGGGVRPPLNGSIQRMWERHDELFELWRFSGYLPTDCGSRPGEYGWGGCALCAIPIFRTLGIAALKVVTRGEDRASKIDCIRVLHEVIADSEATSETIRARIQADSACHLRFRCYY